MVGEGDEGKSESKRLLRKLLAAGGSPSLDVLCRALHRALKLEVGIAVIVGSTYRETVCASSERARRLDQTQFLVDEGPCLEAYRSGKTVRVGDLRRDGAARWPLYTALVAEITPPVRAIFAVPIIAGRWRLGAMDLFSDAAGDLTSAQYEQIEQAVKITVPVLLAQVPRHLRDQSDQRSTLDRAGVHRAVGTAMAELGVGADEALARLRALAFAQGRVVEDLAEDVLAHRIRLRDHM